MGAKIIIEGWPNVKSIEGPAELRARQEHGADQMGKLRGETPSERRSLLEPESTSADEMAPRERARISRKQQSEKRGRGRGARMTGTGVQKILLTKVAVRGRAQWGARRRKGD